MANLSAVLGQTGNTVVTGLQTVNNTLEVVSTVVDVAHKKVTNWAEYTNKTSDRQLKRDLKAFAISNEQEHLRLDKEYHELLKQRNSNDIPEYDFDSKGNLVAVSEIQEVSE